MRTLTLMMSKLTTKLVKNHKPVTITDVTINSFAMIDRPVVTQVKVLYPNGDTEWVNPWDVRNLRESEEFKDE